MNFKSIKPIIFALLVLLLSCEKPERNNPWDEKANIDPAAWAPRELQIEDVSITEKKLSWSYDNKNIEGFKLDRKKGDEEWQVDYQTFPKESRSWNDTEIIPDPSLTYTYSLYAFAGERKSSSQQSSSTAKAIAAPTNLKITNNSILAITLSWEDNIIGEDGFKIERKHTSGSWESLATVTSNNFEDSNFDLNTQVYYRVCGFFGSYTSNWSEENFDSSIPVPENFNIIPNSVTSVQLTWEYSHTGHDGFKIDRRVNEGAWVAGFATVSAVQNNFIDYGINIEDYVYTYRIYSFYQSNLSQYKEKVIGFSCGFALLVDSRDGEEYETVKIGNQCWMKKNLVYLPSVSPPSIGSETTPYFYVYGYEGTSVPAAKATSNYQVYGVLYNWPAALTACPAGWRLPSNNEWSILTNYLGGENRAGGKLKETGTSHWKSPNTGATNSSDFTALPGGTRGTGVSFYNLSSYGYWWSSSESTASYAWFWRFSYDNTHVYQDNYGRAYGFSVRCLKDN